MATETSNTGELEQHAERLEQVKEGAFGEVDNALIDAMRVALRTLIMAATLAVKTQDQVSDHARTLGGLGRHVHKLDLGLRKVLEQGERMALAELVAAHGQIADLKEAVKRLKKQDTERVAELLEATRERNDLKRWVSQDRDDLSRERDKLKADYAALVEINHTGHDRLLKAEAGHAEALRRVNQLNETLAASRRDWNASQDALQQVKVTLDTQTAELETLRRQLAEANTERDANKVTLANQADRIATLLRQFEAAKGDEYRDTVADQAIQIMELRSECTRLVQLVHHHKDRANDSGGTLDRLQPVLKALSTVNWGSVWEGSDMHEVKQAYEAWRQAEAGHIAELRETDPASAD